MPATWSRQQVLQATQNNKLTSQKSMHNDADSAQTNYSQKLRHTNAGIVTQQCVPNLVLGLDPKQVLGCLSRLSHQTVLIA
jgi:hypothetical protein